MTNAWGIDILFEKVINLQKKGVEFVKHPICSNMPLLVGISWKASDLETSEKAKVRGNYVCCHVIFVMFVGPGGAKR